MHTVGGYELLVLLAVRRKGHAAMEEDLEVGPQLAEVVLTGDLHDIKRDYPRDRLVVRTEYPDQIQADFGTACKTMENGVSQNPLPL